MSRLEIRDGQCSLCDELAPLLDGLCSECWETDGTGPLSAWMARVLFAVDRARAPHAWSDYLGAVLSRPAANDGLTSWTLAGTMDEHRWARTVLEAVS